MALYTPHVNQASPSQTRATVQYMPPSHAPTRPRCGMQVLQECTFLYIICITSEQPNTCYTGWFLRRFLLSFSADVTGYKPVKFPEIFHSGNEMQRLMTYVSKYIIYERPLDGAVKILFGQAECVKQK